MKACGSGSVPVRKIDRLDSHNREEGVRAVVSCYSGKTSPVAEVYNRPLTPALRLCLCSRSS